MKLDLEFAKAEDAVELAELRVLAMRPSLEKIGRFDATRARQRLLANFSAEYTRHILVDEERVGFMVLRPQGDDFLLDHLYLHPKHQGRGIGAATLALLIAEMDAQARTLHVGALNGSDANRFYQRHGFVLRESTELDNYYVRQPINNSAANPKT